MAKLLFTRYRFEDLEVWQVAQSIVTETYKLTRSFPSDERFGLTSQFRRAAISISLNIAEGSGQQSPKGFANYVNRAKGSLLECVACARIAEQEDFSRNDDMRTLVVLLEKEYFKLIALEKALRSRIHD